MLRDLPQDLGKFIARDVRLLKRLGWHDFVKERRRRGDFASLKFEHPARRLLLQYKSRGVPVKFHTRPWSREQVHHAVQRGPHQSCRNHQDFLREEFCDMIAKEQWVVLPFSEVKNLKNIRLSPPGVVPQRGRRPRWIVDYSFFGVNEDTMPLAPTESMQFGHALERILREILLADPNLGPVYLMKLDIADGFYRINLSIDDIPKLGVVFPSQQQEEPLVALPLVLPMGWKNSPPVFCAATETSADLANIQLQKQNPKFLPHSLDHHAARLDFARNPHLPLPTSNQSLPQPLQRDPSLPYTGKHLKYVDVFVDDFIALMQGRQNASQVRSILMHAVDEVFRPNDYYDSLNRREPISLKKLRQGDCSWSTLKLVLGWIIDTVNMTISLPQHRQERLADILTSIPPTQKRISAKKWHKVLGELRSMAIALPGARHLFSTMQHALKAQLNQRISLKKGVHDSITDFKWMLKEISNRPTRISELVPLPPSAFGYHDASGYGAGGAWIAADHVDHRGETTNNPLLWRFEWPDDVKKALVSVENPKGTITNSDLELAGGLMHLDIAAQAYDIRERTVLSKTDNMATMFWSRKGSASTDKVPAYLLRLFGIHQRFHRYIPRYDYEPGVINILADDASRLFHLTNSQFLSYFNTSHSQPKSWRLVHPTSEITTAVLSALRKKTCNAESLLVVPPPPTPTGQNGHSSPIAWASIPYSKPRRTKYRSSSSSSATSVQATLQPNAVRSSLDQLRTTYGRLHRRLRHWGSRTQGAHPMV